MERWRSFTEKWRSEFEFTLRMEYDLNENSIVFDLGGYEGWFTYNISKRYNSNIYCFEPIPSYANNIKKRFSNNDKIKVFSEGISDKEKSDTIFINNDASSLNIKVGIPLNINLRKIDSVMEEYKIEFVDLIKINIEGEEYPLLEYMIENNLVRKFGNIQVQFHNFINGHKEKYEKIAKELEKTHYLTYIYPFVWENWKLK